MPREAVLSSTQLTKHTHHRLADYQVCIIYRLSEVNSSSLIAGYSPVCRVQELASDGKREAGRIPRTIECELTSDLVDSCIPGDMVTITAVVKATGSDEGERSSSDRPCHLLPGDTPLLMNSPPHPPLPPWPPGRGRHGKDKCMFLLYLHAISVVNNKGSDASHSLHMQFSTKVSEC